MTGGLWVVCGLQARASVSHVKLYAWQCRKQYPAGSWKFSLCVKRGLKADQEQGKILVIASLDVFPPRLWKLVHLAFPMTF